MIKYKVNTCFDIIEKVEVERETEKQVVEKGGKRSAKITDYECYFDTFDTAKQYLINLTKKEIELLNYQLDYKKKILNERLAIKDIIN